MRCLILFKSVTYAQSGAVRLEKEGISTRLIRKPSQIIGNGCGYGLIVECNNIKKAIDILEKNNIPYSSFWRNYNGKWWEVE